MINSFLSALASIAANKKLLISWLAILSLATAQIGEKVFVESSVELAVVESQLAAIKETLRNMEASLERNAEKLDKLLVEQARLRAEMDFQLERKKK